jgi:Icc-related predicted phosphoesterase
MTLTVYYASDIHGSDVLWRKFVNAGKFYGADVLVMGGDIAGKAVVPIVQRNGGFVARQVTGERSLGEDELPDVEKRIRDMGFYPFRTTDEEYQRTHGDPAAIEAVFKQAMSDSLRGWLDLAGERLAGTDIRLYVMLGNDDLPDLADVIAESSAAVDPEGRVVDLGEDITMMSSGWANPTPWSSPRELPEDELEQQLEALIAQMPDPARSVFNLHVPPANTPIDQAPKLDENLKPVVRGGSVQMAGAGSTAVRDVIERYQPLVALHGHIHESRGIVKIGKTVCINPGSEYGEGVLHGALLQLDRKKGLRSYQLVSG